ncbi:hypothetical protein E3E23_06585 [Thermococcus sp. CX2]|uniref:hypothetical protein n=1 Tax=Thermococcus sp. CX2 TaxID=163006 RepID=UPI00143A0ECD|nr:hypothetical protein [Thermococcus sp. CX2]NJE85490.1 hypothetical protein [Thermococcus sp. CX2]
MEEVRELKSVLERVERKLIAAGKLYGALNFAVWLAIMLLYYDILALLDIPWQFNLVYWPIAFIVAITFTGRVWKRFVEIAKATGREVESSKREGMLIALSWILGIVIGWGVIPQTSIAVNAEARLAVGFLSFITLSILGMFLVIAKFSGTEKEMIPAFLIPGIHIPVVWNMENGAMILAGFVVALGFAVTVLLYIHNAFKAIE